MKEDEMGGIHGRIENSCSISIGESEGKILLRRWEDTIKIDFV
jgi:hypothetical protein